MTNLMASADSRLARTVDADDAGVGSVDRVALVGAAPTAGPFADCARAAAGDDQSFAVAQ